MIYEFFTKFYQYVLKKDIAKQTGFTKVTITGLKVMQFFKVMSVIIE